MYVESSPWVGYCVGQIYIFNEWVNIHAFTCTECVYTCVGCFSWCGFFSRRVSNHTVYLWSCIYYICEVCTHAWLSEPIHRHTYAHTHNYCWILLRGPAYILACIHNYCGDLWRGSGNHKHTHTHTLAYIHSYCGILRRGPGDHSLLRFRNVKTEESRKGSVWIRTCMHSEWYMYACVFDYTYTYAHTK